MERRQQIILIQCAMRRKLARRTLRRRLAAALLIKVRGMWKTEPVRCQGLRRSDAVPTKRGDFKQCHADHDTCLSMCASVTWQCWCPMAVVRHKYRRRLRAIVRIQSFFRSRRARRSFLMIRDLVIGAQAVMRGWRRRKLAARCVHTSSYVQ